MLKTTIATAFIVLGAAVGISAACVQSTENAAQVEPRFTPYEIPNHRHLTRFQDPRRGG